MMLRACKTALVLAVGLFYFFVVFNNLTDYNTNLQFVRHVLTMDSTFPGNRGMWREIDSPVLQTLFYIAVIGWEFAAMLLCVWGGARMARALRASAAAFSKAKNLAFAGLTLGLLLWLVAFLSVGGEWFLMWESQAWNGQPAAFRMFTVIGIVLLLAAMPEAELAE
jgi:predicted small integral membrane protein